MPDQPEEPFNATIVTERLVGTWTFPSREEPTGMGFLHFTEDGQALNFVGDASAPDQRVTIRLWFTIETQSIIRFHPDADSAGWTSGYHFEEGTLTLANPTRTILCLRAEETEIPEWFLRCLEAALGRG